MKKLVLFFTVAVAVAFASCGSKTAQPAEESGEPAIEVITEEVADTAVVVVEEAPAAE